jgi:hypothetical protein
MVLRVRDRLRKSNLNFYAINPQNHWKALLNMHTGHHTRIVVRDKQTDPVRHTVQRTDSINVSRFKFGLLIALSRERAKKTALHAISASSMIVDSLPQIELGRWRLNELYLEDELRWQLL